MIQNRYHVRAQTTLPAKINDNNIGTIFDISAGGAMLATNTPLNDGEIVSLDIELPNYHLKAVGVVVRIYKMYGLQFVNLSNLEKVAITQYIFRFALKAR